MECEEEGMEAGERERDLPIQSNNDLNLNKQKYNFIKISDVYLLQTNTDVTITVCN